MPIYMKVTNARDVIVVPGNVTEKDHKNWIELFSFTWASSDGSIAGHTSNQRKTFDEAIITKLVDVASVPLLKLYAGENKEALNATIDFKGSNVNIQHKLMNFEVKYYGSALIDYKQGEQIILGFAKLK